MDQNCEYDDCLTANVADAHFSTFEGGIQAISSHGSVGLGRNPGKCYMSALVGTRLPPGSRHPDVA